MALTSDVMNVMNTDISSWSTLTGYPLQEHQHHITWQTETATPDWAPDTTGKTKIKETAPDHSLDTEDTTAPAVITCTEATPEHNNGSGTAAIEVTQDYCNQHMKDTVADPTVTHHTSHTANPPHTAAHWATVLRTTVDHIHIHPTDHQNIIHKRGSCSSRSYSNWGTQKLHLKMNREVQIEEPPLDYYTSEDNSTNLGEESESLN